MHTTFFQKLIMTTVSGFFAACLVWFYINIIERGNDDINKNWRNTTGTAGIVTPARH